MTSKPRPAEYWEQRYHAESTKREAFEKRAYEAEAEVRRLAEHQVTNVKAVRAVQALLDREDDLRADAEASRTELLAERHAAGNWSATTGDAAWPWWRNPAFITIAVLLGAVVGVLSWRVTDYAANLIWGGR